MLNIGDAMTHALSARGTDRFTTARAVAGLTGFDELIAPKEAQDG